MDAVILVPEPPERMKEMARELLDLADHPLHVEYVMWPEQGFRVPDYLVAKYAEHREALAPAETEAQAEVEEEPKVEEPVKRKPGRPKKVQEGQ